MNGGSTEENWVSPNEVDIIIRWPEGGSSYLHVDRKTGKTRIRAIIGTIFEIFHSYSSKTT